MPIFPYVINNDTFPNTRNSINTGFNAYAINDYVDGLYNGQFFVWSRGASFTIGSSQAAFGPDGWYYSTSTSSPTVTLTRQSFALGDTLGAINSRFFMRITNASIASPSFWFIQHVVPNVALYSGRRVTVSFWARSGYAKTIALQFVQSSGTGGQVRSTGPLLRVSLTTIWTLYHASFDVPSVAGWTRVVGSETIAVRFWLSSAAGNAVAAGSAFSFESVGDVDIAEVRLDVGDYAKTQIEIYNPNAEAMAVRSCGYNHYQSQDWRWSGNIVASQAYFFWVPLNPMKVPLTSGTGMTITNTYSAQSPNLTIVRDAVTTTGASYQITSSTNQTNAFIFGNTTAVVTSTI